MSDPRRTADEITRARARNAAFAAQAREHEDRATPIGQLWRKAGGGTSGFNPEAFSALLQSEHWAAAANCEPGACGSLPPHLCWWAAIRASVLELRRRPAAKRAGQEQGALFDMSEIEGAA